jgi:hypothetical protein
MMSPQIDSRDSGCSQTKTIRPNLTQALSLEPPLGYGAFSRISILAMLPCVLSRQVYSAPHQIQGRDIRTEPVFHFPLQRQAFLRRRVSTRHPQTELQLNARSSTTECTR